MLIKRGVVYTCALIHLVLKDERQKEVESVMPGEQSRGCHGLAVCWIRARWPRWLGSAHLLCSALSRDDQLR